MHAFLITTAITHFSAKEVLSVLTDNQWSRAYKPSPKLQKCLCLDQCDNTKQKLKKFHFNDMYRCKTYTCNKDNT